MAASSSQTGNLLAFPGQLLSERLSEEDGPGAVEMKARLEARGAHCQDEEYDEVFERLSGRVQTGDRIAASERETAPIRYAELIMLSPDERLERVERDPRFHSYLLAEMFIERSREAWFDDAQASREAAEVALAIARRLGEEHYGSVLPRSLEVRCWGYLANACKIDRDMTAARLAFEKAEELTPHSLLDAYERAELLTFKASYLKELDQWEPAENLLDEITEIYREMEDDHKIGRTLILRGIIQVESGDLEKAIQLFGDSMSLLDDSRDPRLVSCALTNLAHCLNEVGRSEEALSMLRMTRRRIEQFGDRLHLAKARWTEARIAVSLDRIEEAESAFEEVRQFFAAREGEVDSALVCLELATLYAREGKTCKVKALARDIVPTFQRQGLGKEVMAALILFQHAAEQEIATLGLLKEIARYLESSSKDPAQADQGL